MTHRYDPYPVDIHRIGWAYRCRRSDYSMHLTIAAGLAMTTIQRALLNVGGRQLHYDALIASRQCYVRATVALNLS